MYQLQYKLPTFSGVRRQTFCVWKSAGTHIIQENCVLTQLSPLCEDMPMLVLSLD